MNKVYVVISEFTDHHDQTTMSVDRVFDSDKKAVEYIESMLWENFSHHDGVWECWDHYETVFYRYLEVDVE